MEPVVTVKLTLDHRVTENNVKLMSAMIDNLFCLMVLVSSAPTILLYLLPLNLNNVIR